MTLLLAVLAIAYVGSMLMQGRALRGVGLPSGAEWMLLGVALGPQMLAVVDRNVLTAFEPVAAVAIGWLPLALGTRFGRPRTERPDGRALWFGIAFSAISAAVVTAGVYGVAFGVPRLLLMFGRTQSQALLSDPQAALSSNDLWIVAIGAGLVSCELTRHAVTWVVERYDAKGPLASFVTGVSEGSAIVPLLGTALPFALAAPPTALALPFWGLALATLGLGVVLATMCAALLWLEAGGARSWGVLFGAALLGIGIAFRFGLSPLAAMFALGLAIALLSTKRIEIHEMLSRTEHPVRLPILLLAGAQLSTHIPTLWIALLAAAILARLIGAFVCALPLAHASRAGTERTSPPRAPLRSFAFALLPTGSITMTIGLAFALRFPDGRGALVLLIATAQTVLGELLGPVALRRALVAADEAHDSTLASDKSVTADKNAAAPERNDSAVAGDLPPASPETAKGGL